MEDNHKNKKKMEKFLPLFFSQAHLGVVPTFLLTRVVYGNFELCSRLSNELISGYLETLTEAALSGEENSWARSAPPLLFLKAIVRVDGQIIPKNQTIVVKAICENLPMLGLLGQMDDQQSLYLLLEVLNFEHPGHILLSPRGSNAESKQNNNAIMSVHLSV